MYIKNLINNISNIFKHMQPSIMRNTKKKYKNTHL